LRIPRQLLRKNKRGSGQLVKWLVIIRRQSAADHLNDNMAITARLGIMRELIRKI
jgi:hypothetical protein